MTRVIIARTLGVLLGLLALVMLWNGIDALRYSKGVVEYVILTLQSLSAVPLGLSAYWLWRRDRRALRVAALGLALAGAAGTMAASHWAEGAERTAAGFAALGASLALLVVVVLLAWLALKPQSSESAPQPL